MNIKYILSGILFTFAFLVNIASLPKTSLIA